MSIESHGGISDAGWMLFEQSNELIQQIKHLQHDYRSHLQGALVYDPELMEANEALATLLITDIVQVVANGANSSVRRSRDSSKSTSSIFPNANNKAS